MAFSDRRPGTARVAEDLRTPIIPVTRENSREDRRFTRRSAIAIHKRKAAFMIFAGRLLENGHSSLPEGRSLLARNLKYNNQLIKHDTH
jgi:hypothetical protein